MKKIKGIIKFILVVLNNLSILISLFVYFSAKPYFGDLVHTNDGQHSVAQYDNSRNSNDSLKGEQTLKGDKEKRNVLSPFPENNFFHSNVFSITLGIIGGIVAVITPCIYPLLPLTILFFARRADKKQKRVTKAGIYSASVFVLLSLISIPFFLFGNIDASAYSHIASKIWLQLIFIAITMGFAISFFGFFEIYLPNTIALRTDRLADLTSFWGIFFMALTLVVVSFSCWAPIVSLLIISVLPLGVLGLTKCILGFAFGVALPFLFFAIFPSLLKVLPKSGGWLTVVKRILAVIMLLFSLKLIAGLWMNF